MTAIVMTAAVLPTPALVNAAADALVACSDIWASSEAVEERTYMMLDRGLLWPTDEGTAPLATVCFQHPGAGLMTQDAYDRHVARHGGEATCVTCGTPITATTPVGFGPGGGFAAIALDGQTFAWRGGVEVRGAGVCEHCRRSVPQPRLQVKGVTR